MAFSQPEHIVAQLHLKEGDSVADFGAGTGAYSLASAKKVGKSGKVYAIDVQKELLSKISNEGVVQGLSNIEVLWGDIEEEHGTKLADTSVDKVIVVNTLFQVADKKGLIGEARRVLKPRGSIIIIDWSESFGGLGPIPQDVFDKGMARKLLGEHGFTFEREIDAGEHHYGLIASKA